MIHMDEVRRRMEENEEFQKIIDWVSERSEGEVQQKVQSYSAKTRMSWMSKEKFEHLEGGVWRAVEARRRRRDEEQGQSTGQEQGKKDKQVHFGKEEQTEKTQAESTDELEMTGRLVEMRTGRGSSGLVRGRDECRTDEFSRKGKGKGNGGKGEHGSKGGAGSKGTQKVENLVIDEDQENMRVTKNEEEEENHKEDARKLVEMTQTEEAEQEEQRGRVVPNMGAWWLKSPNYIGLRGRRRRGTRAAKCESEGNEKTANGVQRYSEEEGETRRVRWADCEDDEEKEEEIERETQQEAKEKKEQEKEKRDKSRNRGTRR